MITTGAEFAGNKIAGTVDMTAVAVDIKMEPVINGIIHKISSAQMDGGGNILRLHVKGTCKGHTIETGHFYGYMGKGERREDVYQIGPHKGIANGFPVHFCKYHSLRGDQAVKYGDGELFHGIGIFSVRVCRFSAVPHHTDLMPVFS